MTRRADIMRRELRRTVLEAAPGLTNCVWEPFRGPRPARPYASWRPITQPSIGQRLMDDAETLCLPRGAIVQILSAVVGQTYRVRWNYTKAEYVAQAGDTVSEIRNALMASIEADRDPVTATQVDADKILMSGNGPGDLWRVLVTPDFMSATPDPAASVDVVQLTRAPLKMTVSLNIWSDGVGTAGSGEDEESSSFLHKIDVALRKRRVVEDLNGWDLSVTRINDPVNLDGLPASQTEFESRTATDYLIELPYWDSELIEEIDTVEATIETDKGTTTFTV